MTRLYLPRTRSTWQGWAHRRVAIAIRAGRLVRPPACERCGRASDRIEAHHHAGYQNPLTVSWVCRTCHRRAHREHPDFTEYHEHWKTVTWNKAEVAELAELAKQGWS